jgi:hypothetical protein
MKAKLLTAAEQRLIDDAIAAGRIHRLAAGEALQPQALLRNRDVPVRPEDRRLPVVTGCRMRQLELNSNLGTSGAPL